MSRGSTLNSLFVQVALSDEGGVAIDNEMRSNLRDVYAAGDVCTASWEHSLLWFQVCSIYSTTVCVCVHACACADETLDSGEADGCVCC